MGIYENIVNKSKKKDEEENVFQRIVDLASSKENIPSKFSTSRTASENYDIQRQAFNIAQKNYNSALQSSYQKNRAFDFSLPDIRENNFLNSSKENKIVFPSTSDGKVNYFDIEENKKRISKSRDETSDLKKAVDVELNDLKYANYLKNAEKVNSEETTLWDKTGGVIGRALTDVASSLGSDKYKYIDEQGNTIYLPTYSDLKQQKVREDYNSGVGRFLGDVFYNTTKIAGTSALNTVAPGVGTTLYWQDLFLDSYKNSLNEGHDNVKSIAYAIANTGLEYATGKFLGSATKGLTGGKTNELTNALSNVANRITKNPKVASLLGNMGSEATEEFLQEYLDNASRLLILGEDIDLTNSQIFEDALYSAAVGGLSGGLLSSSNRNESDMIKRRVDTYKEFKKALEETKNKTTDVKQLEQIDNLISKTNDYIKNPFINRDLTEQTINLQNQVNNLQSKTNEKALFPKPAYQYQQTDNNKINNLRKSASQYFDNSVETQNMMNTIEKIISDKDYNVVFDDTLSNKNGNLVNAQIKSLKNGEIEIKINPKSNRAVEFLVMHEVTHAIETDSMKKLVMDYASKHSDFDQALENLKQTYGTDEVSSEVLADISGQLFGNQEFINDLSTKQPNIFKRIYNAIVSLANKITGNSKESLFIQDLKNKWEEAYRTQNNNLNNNLQYHTNANISSAIDNILNNINERNPIRLRDYTPKVLVNNGIKNLPMYENPSHVRKNILTSREAKKLGLVVMPKDHYHGLGKDLYIRVIDSLDEPRVIFKNKNNKDYLILTTIKDSQGNNIIVPIEIETTTNANNIKLDINRVKSVYGKGNLNNYIKRNINQKEFQKIYEQKKERGTGLIPAASSFSNDNISQSDGNVKSNTSSTKYSMQELKNNTNSSKTRSDFAKEKFNSKSEINEEIRRLGALIYRENNYTQQEKENFKIRVAELKELKKNFDSLLPTKEEKLTQQFSDGDSSILQNYELTEADNNEISNIASEVINMVDNDIEVTDTEIENRIAEVPIIKELQNDDISFEEYQYNIYEKIMNKISDILVKEGINGRYDGKKDSYVYDRRELAQKGYEKLLDYLDQNNIDYEISRSTEAGYVPSIYIKDSDNNTVFRIANHDNGYIDEYDMVYDNAYNKLFTDKDYANWEEKIIPVLKKQIEETSDIKYSMQENQNDMPLDTTIRRYDDLSKTNYIEYFRKDNGDVRVSLIDTNNNLINQLDLWSNTEAIKQFGEKLGNQLYNYATDSNQKINIGNDINNLGLETDYFMNHRPTQTGLTADNIANQNVETPAPRDIYEHPEYYFQMNEKSSQESLRALKKVKGNPDAEITIYRATPGNKINPGDWITLSKTYANWHNQSQFNGKANVLEMKVKAKDIQFAGDDINEFGYFPDGDVRNSISNKTWQNYLEENYSAKGTRTNMQNIRIPTQEDIKRLELGSIKFPKAESNKILNPLEISNLTPNSANTTPKLPKVNRNKENDGDSHFAVNIENKVGMLTPEQRQTILNDIEAGHYDTITNKDSLETAFNRLNENGEAETRRWFAKDSENATATDVAEGWILLKQYADNNQSDDMVAVAKKLRDMGTKAGQTVQAFNIMARMTPEGMIKYAQSELSEAYDQMVKNKSKKWVEQHQLDFDLTPQETGAIMDIMKKVSTMEDGYDKRVELAKIQKIMTDKLPPERGAGTKAWMRISMLFNPKTQVRNVAGNAVIAPVNYFSDLFASAVDKMVGSKTGYRTTGVTNIKSYVNGFKKGVYESYNDFKKGINTRNIEGNRFEIGSGKSFNNSTTIGKSLNNVDSLLSFMLDVGDRGFYEASFVNSINNQLVLNNTKEVTQDMIDIATSEALQRTWQDSNGYTKMVMSIRNSMNRLNVKGYGLGDILIPFAKTPANLTKAIVDYSPVGLINTLVKGKNLKNAIETGQFTPQMQHQFVQSLGKAVAGTMLYVAGYALAKAGIVSGESDDDKDVRDFMKNTLGVNSYSIKIGNKTFTYDWAQPIAAPLSIMANIVQKDKSDASTLEKIVSSLDTAGNILLEQSFMESINTALNNNDGLVTGIEEAILDLPSRAIPTFMKQIVDLTDSTQRTSFEYDKPIESMVNSIKAKIPGLSKTLAPVVDTMGREVQRHGGKNNIFNVFFNPANVSTENISTSAKEIYRLYKETGDTTIMPRVAPYYLNKSGEKINLTAEQRAEYQKTSGDILEKEIKKLLNSNNYQDMSDAKKKDVIKNIVDYSYNIAQNEVLGAEISQNIQKAYEYSKIGNLSDYYLFKNTVDTTNADTKKNSITTFLLNSKLGDKELAYLYGNYYSSEDELQEIMTLKIPIKEFIKYNSQEFESDYNESTGKAISNSRKRKVIQFVNSLNLSIPQKAILIKKSYNSYNDYNKQIVNYVNNQSLSKYEKASLLKNIGFDEYDSYIINEVNSKKISRTEKERILESMGFKIINGKVYY